MIRLGARLRRGGLVTALLALLLTGCGADEAPERFAYGPEPAQFGELSVPEGDDPHPVVVLVHGGFWSADFDLSLMETVADDLVGRGYAVWNLEFRRLGDLGGGYPNTLDDVADGIEHLAALAEDEGLDLDRVALVGHSSGGHLALWAMSSTDDGSGVVPQVAVGQAAIADLVLASDTDLGRGAVRGLLFGRPEVAPERYLAAQPVFDPSTMVLVHGRDDPLVPFEQTAVAAAAGVPVIVLDGTDHSAHLDPETAAWQATVAVLGERLD